MTDEENQYLERGTRKDRSNGSGKSVDGWMNGWTDGRTDEWMAVGARSNGRI